MSCSCLVIPIPWSPKTSANSLCPALHLSTHFCSGIFTQFYLCHSLLPCSLAFVVLGTPKRICSRSCSVVPHYRLEYPQVLHLYHFSDRGIKISQWVCLELPGTILFSEEYSLGVGCRNSLIMIFRSISFPPSIGSFLPQGPHCSILGMTLQPRPPPH